MKNNKNSSIQVNSVGKNRGFSNHLRANFSNLFSSNLTEASLLCGTILRHSLCMLETKKTYQNALKCELGIL